MQWKCYEFECPSGTQIILRSCRRHRRVPKRCWFCYMVLLFASSVLNWNLFLQYNSQRSQAQSGLKKTVDMHVCVCVYISYCILSGSKENVRCWICAFIKLDIYQYLQFLPYLTPGMRNWIPLKGTLEFPRYHVRIQLIPLFSRGTSVIF